MNYEQTLAYLYKQLPMYQRVGKAAYKSDLTNTIQLCELLNNPENKFKSIHIAGTNGKGSTSHMISSILQEAGYKVGLYTSPHLKDFRERLKINGVMISKASVVGFVSAHKSIFEEINLSFFEWTVGLAFDYFAKQKVDIAIVETGLGGRLDSTNVISPEIAVITNISIDHAQFLGDTIEKIAEEKAGIIKPRTPIVISEEQDEIKDIFINKSSELNAPIYFANKIINSDYACDLKGKYQLKNIKSAVLTIQILIEKGWSVNDINIKSGLLNIVNNTGIKGRWQILNHHPLTICDVGHNEVGIKEIVNQINNTKYNKLHFIFGTVNDKSIGKVLDLLPKTAEYYFCQAKIPRALDVEELTDLAHNKGLRGIKCRSVNEAYILAKEKALADDLIFIGGSTFVVAEIL
jgi:dihydrofolate synthase/folylpolyglutamate synthase